MININLLPWRDDARIENKRQFAILAVATALVGVILIAVIHLTLSEKIARQEQRNNFLTENISSFSTEINLLKSLQKEKQQLLQSLNLIQDLHDSKFRVVRILDEVARLVPNQVHLTKILRTDSKIYFEGTASSNEKITLLMKKINELNWLNNPELNEIEVDANVPSLKHFKLMTQEKAIAPFALGSTKEERHS